MSMRSALALIALCAATATGCGSSSTPDTGTDAGTSGTTDAGTPDTSTSKVSGTLGDLGAAKPVVSSLYISNSGETLVYLSSATITCDTLKNSRWLGSTQADSQVVEIVISGDPQVKTYQVPPEEIHYAKGGRSSSYEQSADTGSITYTKVQSTSLVEGSFSGSFGSNQISGTFHATFCPNGQGY